MTAAALIAAGGVVTAVSPAGASSATPAAASRAVSRHAGASARGHGLNWSGPWHAGVSYSAGDVVSYQGASYVANGASTGRVPSLSPRAWTVLAAAGQPGPRGLTGRPGPIGPPGLTGFAEYYAQPTSSVVVPPGQDVPFGLNGPAGGAVVQRFICQPASEFQFSQAGIYEVSFQFRVLGSSDAGLAVNGVVRAYTIVGTNTESQLVGDSLIQVSAGDVLSVENPPGSEQALVIEPTVGVGGDTLADSLVIKQLSPSLVAAPRRAGAGTLPRPGTSRQARRHRGC
jgi:hypothetical protein